MNGDLDAGDAYVSTGELPDADTVQTLVDEAYERYRRDRDGEVSEIYPALARVPPDAFGISVADVEGDVFEAGDADRRFAIMSVAKPFVFALVCEELGWEEVRRRIGVNATGLPFNALEAVENSSDGRTNPMVNPGAIATVSLMPGGSAAEQWDSVLGGLAGFAGRQLELDEEVYESASTTNLRNRALTEQLEAHGRLYSPSEDALDLYTRQSSLGVSARDLAVMGATLADGGVNPLTRVRVVGERTCRRTLAVMATSGLYETSGDWLYDVGLPGKSGIGGGIVTVSPGKGALGTFAPLLDDSGNSVKGQRVARFLSQSLGLDLFASSAGRST
jgi:glutaminase